MKKLLILASAAVVAFSASATTIYSNNFEGSVSEWAGAGSVSNMFVNSIWTNDSVGLASTAGFVIAPGTAVTGATLSLDFAAVDTWDGIGAGCCGPDSFTVKVDGNPVFTAVFANFWGSTTPGLTPVLSGLNFLGNPNFADSAYKLNIAIGNLSAGSHVLSFSAGGSGWQGGADESFALDNVKIDGTVAAVPEPETYAMLIAGLGVVGFMSKRRKAS